MSFVSIGRIPPVALGFHRDAFLSCLVGRVLGSQRLGGCCQKKDRQRSSFSHFGFLDSQDRCDMLSPGDWDLREDRIPGIRLPRGRFEGVLARKFGGTGNFGGIDLSR